MKKVKFEKISKRYIKNKINKYNLDDESKKYLYEKTLEELRKRKLFLKDMNCISYWIAKGFIEIAFYTKKSYFTINLKFSRKL